jgi:hypothetical protein
MQYPFSCAPATLRKIEAAISEPRLGRYLAEARNDRNRALRLYVWNARLCEAFYLPAQLAEVALRNALHGALSEYFSTEWHLSSAFISPLPERLKQDLNYAIRQCRKEHGDRMTVNHVVGTLPFGFWCHLLTHNYDHTLWAHGMRARFPHAPADVRRHEVYALADRLRQWRNRIAHHGVIFDKEPRKQAASIARLIHWIDEDTSWFSAQLVTLDWVISRKPS